MQWGVGSNHRSNYKHFNSISTLISELPTISRATAFLMHQYNASDCIDPSFIIQVFTLRQRSWFPVYNSSSHPTLCYSWVIYIYGAYRIFEFGTLFSGLYKLFCCDFSLETTTCRILLSGLLLLPAKTRRKEIV